MRVPGHHLGARLQIGLASLVLAVAATGCGAGGSTTTEAVSLKGKTVDFVVPYDPGGGYDVYMRLLAPAFEKCSGATVVVRNEPGAGGLLATTKTYSASPKELRLQIVNMVGAAASQIAEAEGAQYQLERFTWLGRVSAEPNVMVVAKDSPIKDFQDILDAKKPVRFVATGPGSNEYINSVILPEIYDFPAKVATGFVGSEEARAAVLSGDADAHILPLDSQIQAIESGDVRPVLVVDEEPSEVLADTPSLQDFEPASSEQEPILKELVELSDTGRAVAAPPGVDSATRSVLEKAMSCALDDKGVVAKAEKQKREVAPLTGKQIVDRIKQVLGSPEEFQRLLRKAA
ncbi:MAG: Bug family tripartite tricarboxylate transporter substrate binding protein [Micromonosporaceae bacterium]